MNFTIPVDFTHTEKLRVEYNHTAIAYGSGLAEVFATPAMIAFMEGVAYKGIEQFLPQGASTVGMEINVKHLKATLPGKEVTAISIVDKVDGRKVWFSVNVFEEGVDEPIGTAKHTRFVIDTKRFLAKLT